MILMRVFALMAAIFLLCASGASLDRKISDSKKKLKQTRAGYANMDRKLAKIAEEIQRNERSLKELDRVIEESQKQIAVHSVLLEEGQKRLQSLQDRILQLDANRSRQEKALADIVVNRFILGEIQKSKGIQNRDDFIESLVLKQVVRSENLHLRRLQDRYAKTLNEKEKLSKEAKEIRRMIGRMEVKKRKAAEEKVKRLRLIEKLESEKKRYQQHLKKMQQEEHDLSKTLVRLKILKRKTLERERAAREKRNRTDLAKLSKGDRTHVRKIGSSYQRHRVTHYRGAKTFSPVGRAKVVKRFGSFVDPIYKIKIFNESITLKPYRKNAKVKTVLNGKVVFAKRTPLLGKVVIIEHANHLHTIYAKLDKIAPTIREGKRVRRGYVIGRVRDELMFEVTKKDRHINPLELIRLR